MIFSKPTKFTATLKMPHFQINVFCFNLEFWGVCVGQGRGLWLQENELNSQNRI